MSDTVQLAQSARQQLAKALAVLQSPGAEPLVNSVAPSVAQAMGALHQIEASRGAAVVAQTPLANDGVRRALAALQDAASGSPAVEEAMGIIAGSLGIVHQLVQLAGAAGGAAHSGGTVAQPQVNPAAVQARAVAQAQPALAPQAPVIQQQRSGIALDATAAGEQRSKLPASAAAMTQASPPALPPQIPAGMTLDRTEPAGQTQQTPHALSSTQISRTGRSMAAQPPAAQPAAAAHPAAQIPQATDAQIEAQIQAEVERRLRAEIEKQVRAEFAERARKQAEAQAQHAQAQHAQAQHAQAQAEQAAHAQAAAQAQAEQQEQRRAEAEAQVRAQLEAKAQAEQAARHQAAAQAEAQARTAQAKLAEAEALAQQAAQARTAAQVQASTQQSAQVPAQRAPQPEKRSRKSSRKAAPPRSARPDGAVIVEASLGAHSATNFYKGLSGNDVINDGGLFVATYDLLPLGSRVWLNVHLPGGYSFEAAATVRWTRESGAGQDSPGFGCAINSLSEDARQLVYRYARNREPLFHDDL